MRGLTEEELSALRLSRRLADAVFDLPVIHPADNGEFVHHLHAIQNILHSRPSVEEFRKGAEIARVKGPAVSIPSAGNLIITDPALIEAELRRTAATGACLVRLNYRAANGDLTCRVSPSGVLDGCLRAYDVDKAKHSTFRLDRIQDVQRLV